MESESSSLHSQVPANCFIYIYVCVCVCVCVCVAYNITKIVTEWFINDNNPYANNVINLVVNVNKW